MGGSRDTSLLLAACQKLLWAGPGLCGSMLLCSCGCSIPGRFCFAYTSRSEGKVKGVVSSAQCTSPVRESGGRCVQCSGDMNVAVDAAVGVHECQQDRPSSLLTLPLHECLCAGPERGGSEGRGAHFAQLRVQGRGLLAPLAHLPHLQGLARGEPIHFCGCRQGLCGCVH